jgi:hypothetical protein
VCIGDDNGAAAPCAKGITAPDFPIHIAHACDCKAGLPLANGIIFAIDCEQLSALAWRMKPIATVLGLREICAHARDCKAVSAMGDGFIFAFDSKQLLLGAVGNERLLGRIGTQIGIAVVDVDRLARGPLISPARRSCPGYCHTR